MDRAPAPDQGTPTESGPDLRRLVQAFIRSFGLLAGDQTPCGQPLALSHAHALMVLLGWSRSGRAATQRDLAEALGIDKSNVARLCHRMERAGQLTQSRAPHDGRARVLSLTAKGEKLAESLEYASRARFDEVLSAIPPDARGAVLSALEHLNAALAGLAAKTAST